VPLFTRSSIVVIKGRRVWVPEAKASWQVRDYKWSVVAIHGPVSAMTLPGQAPGQA